MFLGPVKMVFCMFGSLLLTTWVLVSCEVISLLTLSFSNYVSISHDRCDHDSGDDQDVQDSEDDVDGACNKRKFVAKLNSKMWVVGLLGKVV